MNTTAIMKDPFYTPILFNIERRILECVHAAKAEGIEMNDSQIRSTLNKVRKTSEGGTPKVPDESPRDQALAVLHADLVGMRSIYKADDGAGNREPLSIKEWTLCIRTIEDSIQHYSTGPGSRGYQDFLEDFIKKGR